MHRAGLLVSQLMLTDSLQQAPWGRAHGSPAGRIPGSLGVRVHCDRCRSQMCTDDLLSKLRCAECRQFEFDRLFEVALRASPLALGGLFAWLLVHRAE